MTTNYETTQEEAISSWKNICMNWCRSERDKALRQTDYIHMPDVTISPEYKAEIVEYRQLLRDFPHNWGQAFDIMSEQEMYSITELSIREALPTKPSEE